MEDGDAARGLRAIVRVFPESGASMFLIDRDDFVKQVVEDLRGEGFDEQRVLQLQWWTFDLRAGLPSAADNTEPGTELLPGIDEATRHPRLQAWAAAIDRSRTLPTTAHDLDISARRQDQQHSPRPNVVVRGDSQTSQVPR